MEPRNLTELGAGTSVELTGPVLSLRDASAARLATTIERGEPLPVGALLAKHIIAASVVAYEDLGPEALFALELEHFPAVVIIDRAGHNFHEQARQRWRRTSA